MDTITFEEFRKVEMRIGKVLSCEKVEDADKLLKLEVDFGSEIGKRQILSGIAQSYSPDDVVGKKFAFVVNLEPREIRGLESQGMILASDIPEKIILLEPNGEVEEGSEIV